MGSRPATTGRKIERMADDARLTDGVSLPLHGAGEAHVQASSRFRPRSACPAAGGDAGGELGSEGSGGPLDFGVLDPVLFRRPDAQLLFVAHQELRGNKKAGREDPRGQSV
jgi:hypothetical protein